MRGLSWIVRPSERKQIKMVKIPKEVARALRARDRKRVLVSIRAGGEELYKGPLTVTSGLEVYLPKSVQELVEGEKELLFVPL